MEHQLKMDHLTNFLAIYLFNLALKHFLVFFLKISLYLMWRLYLGSNSLRPVLPFFSCSVFHTIFQFYFGYSPLDILKSEFEEKFLSVQIKIVKVKQIKKFYYGLCF